MPELGLSLCATASGMQHSVNTEESCTKYWTTPHRTAREDCMTRKDTVPKPFTAATILENDSGLLQVL